jgi:precorrin-2 dehydrogenase/sirohydrochlorin ferrochelatase
MVPISLDPKNARLAIAGNGGLAVRRLQALRAAGAQDVLVFADAAEPALVSAAGAALRARLPDDADLQALHVLWIAGLAGLAEENALAAAARRLRVLVNVEDRPECCDFHSVAEVRRKNLTLTVSTNGKAPGLAGNIRRNLEQCFGPEWDARVEEVAALRADWRAAGVPMAEAARRIDALVAERCWLPCQKTH